MVRAAILGTCTVCLFICMCVHMFICIVRLREIIDLECDNTAKLFQEVRSSLERVCFVKKKNLLMLKQKAKSIAFHEPKFDER